MKDKLLLCKVVGTLCCIVFILGIAIVFSGCTVAFTSSDMLQLNLSESMDKAVQLFTEFEASEGDNVAGDVTRKTGSVCAGGACIIY